MPFVLAIVGRPNVGKSTLFNRLVGRRQALVDDLPGLTRDWREGEGRLGDLTFRVIDTAGLEEAAEQSLAGRMRAGTEQALARADLALFVVDARAGLTGVDRHFARLLHRSGKPVLVTVNKAEGGRGDDAANEALELGFGEAIALSAEHGEGMAELHRALLERMPAAEAEEEDAAEEAGPIPPLRLAIVGRPNVGKSTLVNALIGQERLLTGPEPGITRDAVDVTWRWRDQDIVLIDTAGLRRQARVDERVERLSALSTVKAIRAAHVVALVVDATVMLEKQDLTIGREAIDEGRALVIVANKWDLIEDRQGALRKLRDRLDISLPQVRGVAFVTVSALTGSRLDQLMEAVVRARKLWDAQIKTSQLNRWLAATTEAHPPPLHRGRRPKLRYIVQTGRRPPTFTLFGPRPDGVPEDYMRYLANGLRERFDLPGVPLRFELKGTANPYVDEERRG